MSAYTHAQVLSLLSEFTVISADYPQPESRCGKVAMAGLNLTSQTLPRSAVLSTLLCLPLPAPAEETSLPMPQGDPVLVITGEVGRTNEGDQAVLDLPMLEAMPATEFSTTTLWTNGRVAFTGVELATLVQELEITGERLEAKALNDYRVNIPLEEAVEGGPMIAYKMNGDYMHRRDKGPLWIVYPYDRSVEYRTESVYSRSIWQLDRLHAE
jgi:hypothetical protein